MAFFLELIPELLAKRIVKGLEKESFFDSQFLLSENGKRNWDSRFLILRNRHRTSQKVEETLVVTCECSLPFLSRQVKTTSPEKYKVKPSISNLAAGGTNAVEITVQSAHVASLTAASIARDKFLVAAIVVHSDSLSYDEIADLTKVTYT